MVKKTEPTRADQLVCSSKVAMSELAERSGRTFGAAKVANKAAGPLGQKVAAVAVGAKEAYGFVAPDAATRGKRNEKYNDCIDERIAASDPLLYAKRNNKSYIAPAPQSPKFDVQPTFGGRGQTPSVGVSCPIM